jgi:hypothetical protein
MFRRFASAAVIERISLPEGKKFVPWGRAFTSTFECMARAMVERGLDAAKVAAFKERTKGLSTSMKDGRLVVSVPDGFKMDPSPFAE